MTQSITHLLSTFSNLNEWGEGVRGRGSGGYEWEMFAENNSEIVLHSHILCHTVIDPSSAPDQKE